MLNHLVISSGISWIFCSKFGFPTIYFLLSFIVCALASLGQTCMLQVHKGMLQLADIGWFMLGIMKDACVKDFVEDPVA